MFAICLASSAMMSSPTWPHRVYRGLHLIWFPRLATEGDLFHWVEHLKFPPGPERESSLP